MKKFTVSAIMAMGVVVLSSAAFAGTTSAAYRGCAVASVADTVVPVDTVVPADTVVPVKKDTVVEKTESSFANDTVVPVDTVTVPTDTVAPAK